MSDINRVILTGRLVRDPEKVVLDSGKSLLRMTVASNRYAGPDREEEALFIDATLFGTQAESLAGILRKGIRVGIDGRLQQRRWIDADGMNHSTIRVLVDRLMLIDKRDSGEDSAGASRGASAVGEESDIPF